MLLLQNLRNDLYSTCWRFLTDSIIAILIQWQYFLYILCKLDQDWSSNPRDERLQGQKLTFLTKRQKSAFRTKYFSMYGHDRNHIFCADRQMYADYKAEIIFAVVEETLQW